MKKIFNITFVLAAVMAMSSCYKEQHFSVPGASNQDTESSDTMPFPFDASRQAGEYLVKDGKVDFSRVSFMGFTDFVPTLPVDSNSWYQGDGFYGNVQHKTFYPKTDAVHYGNYQYSYTCNDVYFKPFLEIGNGKQWYFYAKMSLTYLNDTRSAFWFGGAEGYAERHLTGFDRGAMSLFSGKISGNDLISGSWPTCPELIIPDEPFEVEIVCVNGFAYVKINGTLLWSFNLPAGEHSKPMTLRTWGNSVKIYDIYIEGDYEEENVVAYKHEKEAVTQQEYATIQVPALTHTGNDVLLFAEGRVNNFALTSNVNAKKSNATDIVMKRSTDGGTTWSAPTAIVGDRSAVNLKPAVVTGGNGILHLFYTVDHSAFLKDDYRIYMTTSSNGNVWSAPVLITTDLPGEYTTQTTVSGHGIRMKSGRLLVLTSCVKSGEKNMAVLYSDNDGGTWECGGVVPEEKDAANGNLVELADGRLMMMIGRSTGTTKDRRVSYSSDGGITWSEPVTNTVECGASGCRYQGVTLTRSNGELVHLTPMEQKAATAFNPTGDEKLEQAIYQSPSFASGLSMAVSSDNGTTWSTPVSLFSLKAYKTYKFLSGYMDAIVLDDGSVLCVTEGGAVVPYEGLVAFKCN